MQEFIAEISLTGPTTSHTSEAVQNKFPRLTRLRWSTIVAASLASCVMTVFTQLASAQVFYTVGVYDENNNVQFVAPGSALSLSQFKSDVAAAFATDLGGVNQCYAVAGEAGPYTFSYGASQTKRLSMTGGPNTRIGGTASTPQLQAISGVALWASLRSEMTLFLTNAISSIPHEVVTQFGLTMLSTSYFAIGDVIATARFSDGSEASAHRLISEPGGMGNTFFGFAAPSGQSIVSVTFTNTSGHFLYFDDIGFITAAPPSLKIQQLDPSRARISWSTNFTGYALEFTANLEAPAWTAETNTQTVMADQVTVTIDSAVGQRFYRLRRP